MQLELHAHEQLDKAWRRLAKRDAKAVQSDPTCISAAKQPEAVFLPQMLDEFLQVRPALHVCLPAPEAHTFVCPSWESQGCKGSMAVLYMLRLACMPASMYMFGAALQRELPCSI